MCSRVQGLVRPVVRGAVITSGVLAAFCAGSATALADAGLAAETQVASVPFGLLGPVGLVAVALGLIGMLAGLARRRREMLSRSAEARRAAEAHRAAAIRAAQAAARAELAAGRAAGSAASRRDGGIPAPSRPPSVEQAAERRVERAA